MHHHLEIVMPPTSDVESAVAQIMRQYDENMEEDEDHSRVHAFWDWYVIGGRWSGNKLMAKYDQTKVDQFYEWLKEEKVTVSGLKAGKDELSPASQIPKVDAKWREMMGASGPCPLFRHAGDSLPNDIDFLSKVPEGLTCSRVIFANPAFDGDGIEAGYMLVDSAWNGCNYMRVDWDGKFSSALDKYRESLKNYKDEYRDKYLPKDDWLVVTVDYHS